MTDYYPLRLEGISKKTIWGGKRIFENFSGDASDGIGERWILSAREKEDCKILNGKHRGTLLTEYLKRFLPEAYPFPLLIKFIDACDRLSVQVHPDDLIARVLGDDKVGKTEMWHIIYAEEGANIVYGIKSGVDIDMIKGAIEEDRVETVLNFVPVKPGDTFFIPAGLIHAIGKGILLVEVQQNSDTTYRFYDYGRVDSQGNHRELHIEKALAATKSFSDHDISSIRFNRQSDSVELLADCEYFKVARINIDGKRTILCDESDFISLVCLSGGGFLEYGDGEEAVSAGDSFIVPQKIGEVTFKGKATVIISSATASNIAKK